MTEVERQCCTATGGKLGEVCTGAGAEALSVCVLKGDVAQALCGPNASVAKGRCSSCPALFGNVEGKLVIEQVTELQSRDGKPVRAARVSGCSKEPVTQVVADRGGWKPFGAPVDAVCTKQDAHMACRDGKTERQLIIDVAANKLELAGTDSFSENRGFGALGLKGARGGGGISERGIGLANVGTAGRGLKNENAKKRAPRPAVAVPKIVLSRPTVEGKLDREIVRRVVRQHRREIKYCYELGLSKDAELKGRVVLAYTISATGSVVSAVVVESSLNNKAVERCLTGKARRWKFPEPNGGIVKVTHPIHFTT